MAQEPPGLPAGRPLVAEFHRLRWEGGTGAPYVAELPARTPADTSGWTLEWAATAAQGSDAAERDLALAFLGSTADAASPAVLHRLAASATVQGDPEVLSAIGRRGDRSSVGVLADKPLSAFDYDVIRARICGLANIRTTESIDALMNAMTLASPPPGEPFVFIDDLCAALCPLTGTDHGPWRTAWNQWWRQSRPWPCFVVPQDRPEIAPRLALRWDGARGEPRGR